MKREMPMMKKQVPLMTARERMRRMDGVFSVEGR
jgi:hypothetical protein